MKANRVSKEDYDEMKREQAILEASRAVLFYLLAKGHSVDDDTGKVVVAKLGTLLDELEKAA